MEWSCHAGLWYSGHLIQDNTGVKITLCNRFDVIANLILPSSARQAVKNLLFSLAFSEILIFISFLGFGKAYYHH